jgi:hypothetical protein
MKPLRKEKATRLAHGLYRLTRDGKAAYLSFPPSFSEPFVALG